MILFLENESDGGEVGVSLLPSRQAVPPPSSEGGSVGGKVPSEVKLLRSEVA